MQVKLMLVDKATGKGYKFNGTHKEFRDFMKDVPTLEQLMKKAKHQALIEKTKQLELF